MLQRDAPPLRQSWEEPQQRYTPASHTSTQGAPHEPVYIFRFGATMTDGDRERNVGATPRGGATHTDRHGGMGAPNAQYDQAGGAPHTAYQGRIGAPRGRGDRRGRRGRVGGDRQPLAPHVHSRYGDQYWIRGVPHVPQRDICLSRRNIAIGLNGTEAVRRYARGRNPNSGRFRISSA